jgi:exonuclease SbcC
LDWQNKLNASYFENEATITKILASNLNVVKERQKLTEFKNQKLLVSARLTDLTERLQGKVYDLDNHNALLLDIQTIERQMQAQNQALGELKRDIFDKTNRLNERQKIEKIVAECDIRAENLKILRGLFQRSGFVNYASSVYLQSIIKAANERFMKLTKQQLRLEITENNGFIVRDMLNDGQFRDVRTLSGGQTFQAALSLALALSDHIQSRNAARQNFFFLDEGFGSLDRESLHIVFETLKALRKENRIVGIISHVEDMRLEIERYLEVSLSESKGSQVNLVIG